MACSCTKYNNKDENISISNNKAFPLDTCPMCAFKHLSYALIKFNTDKVRCLAEIYLAYKHLYLNFNDESIACFNLIKDYFNDELTVEKIRKTTELIHNLAIKEKNNEITKTNSLKLNLEDELNHYYKIYLNLIIANELYNYEVGYKDINTSYVIGLLQECAEFEKIEMYKEKIRIYWKKIEDDKILNSDDFLKFANQFLYRYKKDEMIKNM